MNYRPLELIYVATGLAILLALLFATYVFYVKCVMQVFLHPYEVWQMVAKSILRLYYWFAAFWQLF